MAVTSVTGDNGVSALVNQLMKKVDSNGDGQISTAEFGAFLTGFLGYANGTSAAASAASTPAPAAASDGAFRGQMLGFDLSRIETASNTPKYAFAKLAQNLAPTDANMQTIAAQLGSSVGHLDSQNNFMLDADAGGYIGVRDRGFGPVWQWMAYNPEHPGPNGEIT